MMVRQSIANPKKNSLVMFTKPLPDEISERKSKHASHSDRPQTERKSVPIVWTKMCTGSSYFGRCNQFGFNGQGIYRFPDGRTTYQGELKDGHFHGHGKLTYPNGNVINGYWEMGVNKFMKLRFADGLMFEKMDWDYCMPPDRRYAMDEFLDLPPVGQHSVYPQHSNADNMPTGYYYTGEGYFDPVTKCLFKMHVPTQVLRIPTDDEVDWILKNCARKTKNEFSTVQKELLEDVDYEL